MAIGVLVLLGCLVVASRSGEPLPNVTDEFSYLLSSNTFASGRLANPAPQIPALFDSMHILVSPVYVSKQFPAQGLFLAAGEILTGHPIVGVWLSSALACAVLYWMLQPWFGTPWAVFGAALAAGRWGINSYWSQSYWGGMVPALGGALFFGSMVRLRRRVAVGNLFLLSTSIVILCASRPIEALTAMAPYLIAAFAFLKRYFFRTLPVRHIVISSSSVLLPAAIGILFLNHATTGSFTTPTYVLHERQYQSSPPFVFMPMRPSPAYSSQWLKDYYDRLERQQYLDQRTLSGLLTAIDAKVTSWWHFYFGLPFGTILGMSLCVRHWHSRRQRAFLFAALVAVLGHACGVPLRGLALAAAVGVGCSLFAEMNGPGHRLVFVTLALTLCDSWLLKWYFPHYFAPGMPLVVWLWILCLRRLWHYRAELYGRIWRFLRLAAVATVALASVADSTMALSKPRAPRSWGSRRATVMATLRQRPGDHLVFVRYGVSHSVVNEWVYNHADIAASRIVWARDLGSTANDELVRVMGCRRAWLLEFVEDTEVLTPYGQATCERAGTPVDDVLPW